MSKERHDEVLKSRVFHCFSDLFAEYTVHLRNTNGPLPAFWMSYIDMIELLPTWSVPLEKGIGKSISPVSARCSHGAFPTMLSTTQDTCQLIIAIWQVYQISTLKLIRNGGISVQLSNDNTFGRIPVYQTLEETVNKDTQTPGGTKGLSLKPGAV